jgi:hypothetical protein
MVNIANATRQTEMPRIMHGIAALSSRILPDPTQLTFPQLALDKLPKPRFKKGPRGQQTHRPFSLRIFALFLNPSKEKYQDMTGGFLPNPFQ